MLFCHIFIFLNIFRSRKTVQVFNADSEWAFTEVFRFENKSLYLISKQPISDEIKPCIDAKLFHIDESNERSHKDLFGGKICLSYIKHANNAIYMIINERKDLYIFDMKRDHLVNHSYKYEIMEIVANEVAPEYYVIKKRVDFLKGYVTSVCTSYGAYCKEFVGNFHSVKWYMADDVALIYFTDLWYLARIVIRGTLMEEEYLIQDHHTGFHICGSNIFATIFNFETGAESMYFIDKNMKYNIFWVNFRYPPRLIRITYCDESKFLAVVRDFDIRLGIGYFNSKNFSFVQHSLGYYFVEALKCPTIFFDSQIPSIIHSHLTLKASYKAEYLPFISLSAGRIFTEIKVEPDYRFNQQCKTKGECNLYLIRDCSVRVPFYASTKSPGLRLASGLFLYDDQTKPHPIMLFVSRDFGQTWEATLPGDYFVTSGFNGSALIAVAENATQYLLSFDEGVTWDAVSTNTHGKVKSIKFDESNTLLEIYLRNEQGYVVHYAKLTTDKEFCKDDNLFRWIVPNVESQNDCINGAKWTYPKRKVSCRFSETFTSVLKHVPCECTNIDLLCKNDTEWIQDVCFSTNYNYIQGCENFPWSDKPTLVNKTQGNLCEQKLNNIFTYRLGSDFELCRKYEHDTTYYEVEDTSAKQWVIVKTVEGFYIYPVDKSDIDFVSYLKVIFEKDFIERHLIGSYTVDMTAKCVFAAVNCNQIYRGCFKKHKEQTVNFAHFYSFQSPYNITDIKMDGRHENILIFIGMEIYMLKNSFRFPLKIADVRMSEKHHYFEASYGDKLDNIALISVSSNNSSILNLYQWMERKQWKLQYEEDQISLMGTTAALFKRGSNKYNLFDMATGLYNATDLKLNQNYDFIHVLKLPNRYLVLGILNGSIYNFESKYYINPNSALLGLETYAGEVAAEKCGLLEHCIFYTKILRKLCPIGFEKTSTGCSCRRKECRDENCKDGFMCGNSACINKSLMCDGRFDCDDLSDEKFCTICQPDEQKCKNSDKCIKKFQVCDHVVDCPEKEDEMNCKRDICPKNTTYCNDGRCVNSTMECITDCPQKSYKCMPSQICIPQSSICDKKFDCPSFEDEGSCMDECDFTCLSGGCVKMFEVCDQRDSCPHGDDEWKCSNRHETNVDNALKIGVNVLLVVAITLVISSVIYCFIDAYVFHRADFNTVNEPSNYTEIPFEQTGPGYLEENEEYIDTNAGFVYVVEDEEQGNENEIDETYQI